MSNKPSSHFHIGRANSERLQECSDELLHIAKKLDSGVYISSLTSEASHTETYGISFANARNEILEKGGKLVVTYAKECLKKRVPINKIKVMNLYLSCCKTPNHVKAVLSFLCQVSFDTNLLDTGLTRIKRRAVIESFKERIS